MKRSVLLTCACALLLSSMSSVYALTPRKRADIGDLIRNIQNGSVSGSGIVDAIKKLNITNKDDLNDPSINRRDGGLNQVAYNALKNQGYDVISTMVVQDILSGKVPTKTITIKTLLTSTNPAQKKDAIAKIDDKIQSLVPEIKLNPSTLTKKELISIADESLPNDPNKQIIINNIEALKEIELALNNPSISIPEKTITLSPEVTATLENALPEIFATPITLIEQPTIPARTGVRAASLPKQINDLGKSVSDAAASEFSAGETGPALDQQMKDLQAQFEAKKNEITRMPASPAKQEEKKQIIDAANKTSETIAKAEQQAKAENNPTKAGFFKKLKNTFIDIIKANFGVEPTFGQTTPVADVTAKVEALSQDVKNIVGEVTKKEATQAQLETKATELTTALETAQKIVGELPKGETKEKATEILIGSLTYTAQQIADAKEAYKKNQPSYFSRFTNFFAKPIEKQYEFRMEQIKKDPANSAHTIIYRDEAARDIKIFFHGPQQQIEFPPVTLRVFNRSELEKFNTVLNTIIDGSYFDKPFTIDYAPFGAESNKSITNRKDDVDSFQLHNEFKLFIQNKDQFKSADDKAFYEDVLKKYLLIQYHKINNILAKLGKNEQIIGLNDDNATQETIGMFASAQIQAELKEASETRSLIMSVGIKNPEEILSKNQNKDLKSKLTLNIYVRLSNLFDLFNGSTFNIMSYAQSGSIDPIALSLKNSTYYQSTQKNIFTFLKDTFGTELLDRNKVMNEIVAYAMHGINVYCTEALKTIAQADEQKKQTGWIASIRKKLGLVSTFKTPADDILQKHTNYIKTLSEFAKEYLEGDAAQKWERETFNLRDFVKPNISDLYDGRDMNYTGSQAISGIKNQYLLSKVLSKLNQLNQ